VWRQRRSAALAATCALVLGACGASSAASTPGSTSAPGAGDCYPVGDVHDAKREVDLELDEWRVTTAVASVPRGTIAFLPKNVGKENHELLVVRAPSVAALPRAADGSVDESALSRQAVVGRVQAFRPGLTCPGVFRLAPGNYVLLCNLVQHDVDGTVTEHVAQGTATGFTVTG
jgi:hypothetical protein